jgi:hypothetical protein
MNIKSTPTIVAYKMNIKSTPTIVAYKMNIKSIEKASKALGWFFYVSTLMNKFVALLMKHPNTSMPKIDK